jgi:uncharacterized protein
MNHELPKDELEAQPPVLAPPSASIPAEVSITPPTWTVPAAFFNWAGSLAFALLIPLIFILVYGALIEPSIFQDLKTGRLTKPLMLLQLVGTFGGQVCSLVLSWVIVTGLGRRSFLGALGLQWTSRFKLPHSVALGAGMFVLSLAIMSVLPRQETDMDKFLKVGLLVRVILALVATIGAPLQEEIVYRGVLYTALEKSLGMRWSIVIVSLLFGAVHVVQYRQSIATLVAVFLLSLVLTVLRAWTGKLLPCIATHLFFNGIQGIMIIFMPEQAVTPDPAPQPAMLLLRQAFGE